MSASALTGKKSIFLTVPGGLEHKDKASLLIIDHFRSACLTEGNRFVPFPRSLAIEAGRDYAQSLKELVNCGILEQCSKVLDGGQIVTYSPRRKICQHFRLNKDFRELVFKNKTKIVEIDFTFKGIDPKPMRVKCSTDGMVEKSLENIFYKSDLLILDEWRHKWFQPVENRGSFISAKRDARILSEKNYEIKRPRIDGRVFHPMIWTAKEIRQFVVATDWRKSNAIPEPLIEVDAKSMHPYLLATLGNSKDRNKWLEMMDSGDFYQRFVDSTYSRDRVKKVFQVAISDCKRYGQKAIEIREFLASEVPSIFESVCDQSKGTVQGRLQQVESQIFLDSAFLNLNAKGISAYPQHDGFAIFKGDIEEVKDALRESMGSILGYQIPIEQQTA